MGRASGDEIYQFARSAKKKVEGVLTVRLFFSRRDRATGPLCFGHISLKYGAIWTPFFALQSRTRDTEPSVVCDFFYMKAKDGKIVMKEKKKNSMVRFFCHRERGIYRSRSSSRCTLA